MKFADFNLTLTDDEEVWTCNIHDDCDDDEVVIVDCMTRGSGINNTFAVRDIGVLETLLLCYFGFNDKDVNRVLNLVQGKAE